MKLPSGLRRVRFSISGLALLVLGFALGLTVGRTYAPYRDAVPSEASIANMDNYVLQPYDELSIKITYPTSDKQTHPFYTRVESNGAVAVGAFGAFTVAGLTVEEARERLSRVVRNADPKANVSLDFGRRNGKNYYVITDRNGGDTIYKLKFTGDDNVLDALARVHVDVALDKYNIWITRTTTNSKSSLILPIDYTAAAKDPASNYQLLPGDRLFVSTKPMPK